MKIVKIIKISIIFLFFILSITSCQAMAMESFYYMNISLFHDGHAEFQIDVDDYGNLGGVVIELPILICENNFSNTSDIRNKIRVSNIPDIQTLEGNIDLDKNCMGIGITRPRDVSQNFSISFAYKNNDWEYHPEKYPFDNYNMSILISFPEIITNDTALVSTRILLPPNTEVKKISVYRLWEHPARTKSELYDIDYIIDKNGNQQVILLESHSYLTKNNPAQAIYIPLEFKRAGNLPKFYIILTLLLIIILILFTILLYKHENIDIMILAAVALVFSYYQFLVSDKPAGFTTILDNTFFILIIWISGLFIYNMLNKLKIVDNIQKKLRFKVLNKIHQKIFFILIPLVMIVFYISSQFFPLEEIFALYPENPTIFSFYFSHYFHFDFVHFFGNIINYFIVIFIIFKLETDRKQFNINMFLIFLLLPAIISVFTIYNPLSRLPFLGFSGILSGLLGYLVYSVYKYLKMERKLPLDSNFINFVVLYNVLLILLIYKLYLFSFFITTSLIIIGYFIRSNFKIIIYELKSIFVCISLAYLMVTPFALFPQNIMTGSGNIINIPVHYFGYFFGIYVPWILVEKFKYHLIPKKYYNS